VLRRTKACWQKKWAAVSRTVDNCSYAYRLAVPTFVQSEGCCGQKRLMPRNGADDKARHGVEVVTHFHIALAMAGDQRKDDVFGNISFIEWHGTACRLRASQDDAASRLPPV
jgi:hypothetical protein